MAEKQVLTSAQGIRTHHYDVSQRSEVHSFLEELKHKVSIINILVNSPGSSCGSQSADTPMICWDTVIDTNLNALFILTREIGRNRVASGSAKIIFTASLITFKGGLMVPSYAASKGAIGSLELQQFTGGIFQTAILSSPK